MVRSGKGNGQVMSTKIIVIIAASVAVVFMMFVLGKLADGKDDRTGGSEK